MIGIEKLYSIPFNTSQYSRSEKINHTLRIKALTLHVFNPKGLIFKNIAECLARHSYDIYWFEMLVIDFPFNVKPTHYEKITTSYVVRTKCYAASLITRKSTSS